MSDLEAVAMRCDQCPRVRLLMLRIGRVHVCAACWRAAGRPAPHYVATPAELAAIEAATRKKMLDRGGADRHLVRAGRS